MHECELVGEVKGCSCRLPQKRLQSDNLSGSLLTEALFDPIYSIHRLSTNRTRAPKSQAMAENRIRLSETKNIKNYSWVQCMILMVP